MGFPIPLPLLPFKIKQQKKELSSSSYASIRCKNVIKEWVSPEKKHIGFVIFAPSFVGPFHRFFFTSFFRIFFYDFVLPHTADVHVRKMLTYEFVVKCESEHQRHEQHHTNTTITKSNDFFPEGERKLRRERANNNRKKIDSGRQ